MKKIIIIRRRTQRTREWVYIIIYVLIQLLCVHIPIISYKRDSGGKKRGYNIINVIAVTPKFSGKRSTDHQCVNNDLFKSTNLLYYYYINFVLESIGRKRVLLSLVYYMLRVYVFIIIVPSHG